MRLIALTLSLCVSAVAAQADVTVTFSEGAPTDRFTISTTDACVKGPVEVAIDLSGSSAGLIFDVTESGAGVEVFQPFVLVAGQDLVTEVTPLADGDRGVALSIASLLPGQPIAFTTDVDDTIGQREITVSGAEIAGATVELRLSGVSYPAVFGSDAIALIDTPDCSS